MSACTFFGHRFVPDTIEPALYAAVRDLIEKHGVDRFYVGNHGGFDVMVRRVLKKLSAQYPITYSVVLAYMPQKRNPFDLTDYSDTLLPEGMETVPRRFAIVHRNRWMLRQADYVITYVTVPIASGAAQCKEWAQKHHKKVINLA